MALQAIVDSVDALPEAIRGEYTKAADGKFHLNIEGGDNLPFVSGLKTALQSERALRAKHESAVKSWEKLGKTPDEISEMLAAIEAEGTDKLKKKGDFDALLKQHQDKWNGEKTALEKRLAGRDAAARTAIVDSAVQSALAKAKATSEGLELLVERLGRRVNLEIDDDGKRAVSIMQADGKTPLAGSGADGTATFDDLVKEAIKQYPSLFEGTGAGGGGKPPREGAGGAGGKTMTRAEFEKLGPVERADTIKNKIRIVD